MNATTLFQKLRIIFNDPRIDKLKAAMTKAGIIPKFYTEIRDLDVAAILYAIATVRVTDQKKAIDLLGIATVNPKYNETIRELQFWLKVGGEDLRFALIFENGCGIFQYQDGRREISLGHTKEAEPLIGEPLYIDGSVFETLQNAINNG